MIGWLIRWCSRSCADTRWAPTGYTFTTDTRYDQDKAVNGRLRALERAKAARKVADRYSRQAEVIRLADRKGAK
jgi:hypothetical protein